MSYRDKKKKGVKSFNQNTAQSQDDLETAEQPTGAESEVQCPSCGKAVTPKMEGEQAKCPECGAELQMPDGTKTIVLMQHDPLHEHTHSDGTTHAHEHTHVDGVQHEHPNAHTHQHAAEVKTYKTQYSDAERAKLAKEGKAKSDGSYPIVTRADLENAIKAWGRGGAKESDKAWIEKRAKELEATDLLPEDWAGSTKKKDESTKTLDVAFVTFGDSLKTLGAAQDHLVPVGGYLIRFSDEHTPDLTGEFFTPETDFGSATRSDVWFHHLLPVNYRDADGSIKSARVNHKFPPADLTKDKVGVFFKSVLDERDEYEKYVLDLIYAGKLGTSSGTPTHLIDRKTMPNGAQKVTRWILGTDASYDHTPAEWRGNVVSIQNIKSFVVDSLPLAEAQGTREANVKTSPNPNGTSQFTEDKMTEEEKKALEEKLKAQEKLIAEQGQALAAQGENVKTLTTQVATLTEVLKKEPAREQRVQIDPDEKHPYKSFKKDARGRLVDATGYGEFLMDVRDASQPIPSVSPRLAAVRDAGMKSFKAATGLTAQIPSAGGFFVQTDHSAELVKNMFEQGKLLSMINKTPLGPGADGVTLNGVDETTRATTLWGGILPYWLAEADTITASKPKFREIKLEVKGLAALYYATDKVAKLAPALGMEVANGFRGAMTYFVEEAIIQGSGAGKPLGLLATSLTTSPGSTIGVTRGTTLVVAYADIVNMDARLLPEAEAGSVWIINKEVMPQLNSLYLPTGIAGIAPPFVSYGADGVARMMGRPIIVSEHCNGLGTQGDIILWSPSTYRFCDLGDVEEATSIHVEFLTAQNVYRYLYYCDGQPQLAKTLTPKHGTSTLSTQVTLTTV